MFLLVFVACAPKPAAPAAAASSDGALLSTADGLIARAAAATTDSSWFDGRSWGEAVALPMAEFAAGEAMEGGFSGATPFDDGVDPAEWARLQDEGAAWARATLAAAGPCHTTGTFATAPAATVAALAARAEPGVEPVRGAQLLTLTCAHPEVAPMSGNYGVVDQVAGVVVVERGGAWRIADVTLRATGALWSEWFEPPAEEEKPTVVEPEPPRVATWSPPGGATPVHAAPADVDGDGKADTFLGASGDGVAVVLLAGGPRRFAAPFPSRGFGADGAVAGDLDGDGIGDLALGVPGDRGEDIPGAVWVLRGGRGFDPTRRLSLEAGAIEPDLLLPGDLDGDGRPELVVVHDHVVDVWFGGALDAARGQIQVDPGGGRAEVVPGGDVDGDGAADLWVRRADLQRVWLVHGGAAPRVEEVGALGAARLVGAVDLDGDGRCEVVTASSVGGGAAEVYRQGDAGWALAWRAAGVDAQVALGGDFDHDGHPELAVSDARGAVAVYRADGTALARLVAAPGLRNFGTRLAAREGGLVVVSAEQADLYVLPAVTPSRTWSLR